MHYRRILILNIVWSGNGSVHYVRFNYDMQPTWTYYKKVSDTEIGACDIPAIALSQDKIHISYRHFPVAKTRDMLKADYSWSIPQVVADVPMNMQVIYQNIFSINNQLHCLIKYLYFPPCCGNGDLSSRFVHYIRSTDNLTWELVGTFLSADYTYNEVSVLTTNNKIHLIYYDHDNAIWMHRTFENGDWSDPISVNIGFRYSKTLNAVGNNLYLTFNDDEETPSAVMMHQYYDAPIIPANFILSTSTGNHPLLTWAFTEPEVYYNSYNGYRLEKRLGLSESPYNWGSWTSVVMSGSINQYEDVDVTRSQGSSPLMAEYRLKAYDNVNYSPYTNSLDFSYNNWGEKIVGKNNGKNLNSYNLSQNFPNPFNPSTEISYQLPSDGYVKLKAYNMMGQEVMTLVNGFKEKGIHSATFNAGNLASGLYIYKLDADNFTQVKKMLLTK